MNHWLNIVWEHSAARGAARLVALSLADRANNEGRAWSSVEDIQQRTRLSSPRVVRQAVAKLVALGEWTVELTKGGRGVTNTYTITLRPPDETVAPSAPVSDAKQERPAPRFRGENRGATRTETGAPGAQNRGAQRPTNPLNPIEPTTTPAAEPGADGGGGGGGERAIGMLREAGIVQAAELASLPHVTPDTIAAVVAEQDRAGLSAGWVVTTLRDPARAAQYERGAKPRSRPPQRRRMPRPDESERASDEAEWASIPDDLKQEMLVAGCRHNPSRPAAPPPDAAELRTWRLCAVLAYREHCKTGAPAAQRAATHAASTVAMIPAASAERAILRRGFDNPDNVGNTSDVWSR